MNDKRIIVCIPTFRRNALLRNCLLSIGKLEVPDKHEVQIIVVDNDERETARLLCTELAAEISCPLHYFVQAVRGLSSVRNSLLNHALRFNADIVAFIDDDEQADPQWLVQHLNNMEKYDADVCSGPVRPVGSQLPSPSKKVYKTGSCPRHVSTNNVLFKTALITKQQLRFDPFYNFIGGEDFDFFERSSTLGNVHIRVEEALVYETIPAERNHLRYLFYRHFTGGINSIMRYRRSHPAWRAWLRFLPKIAGKLVGTIVYSLLACVKFNKMYFFTSVKKLANGLGCFAGLLNVVMERYRNIEVETDLSIKL